MPNPNDELARLADAVNDHDHALKTGTSILSYNKGLFPPLGGTIKALDLPQDGSSMRLRYSVARRIWIIVPSIVVGIAFVALGIWCYQHMSEKGLALVPAILGGLLLLIIALGMFNVAGKVYCELNKGTGIVRYLSPGMQSAEEVPMSLLSAVVLKDVQVVAETLDGRNVPLGGFAVAAAAAGFGAAVSATKYDPERRMPYHLYLEFGGIEFRIGTSRERDRLLQIGSRIAAFLEVPLLQRQGAVQL
jgi:hypothetical protein